MLNEKNSWVLVGAVGALFVLSIIGRVE